MLTHERAILLSNNMASQKYWQDEIDAESESLGDTEDELLTQEEAEAIFRFECKEWIRNHSEELLKSPFKTAYKRPWTKKTSSQDFLTKTNTEKNGGKKSQDFQMGE